MTQINSNNEEESNTETTGQIEKLADDNNQNVNKAAVSYTHLTLPTICSV